MMTSRRPQPCLRGLKDVKWKISFLPDMKNSISTIFEVPQSCSYICAIFVNNKYATMGQGLSANITLKYGVKCGV